MFMCFVGHFQSLQLIMHKAQAIANVVTVDNYLTSNAEWGVDETVNF